MDAQRIILKIAEIIERTLDTGLDADLIDQFRADGLDEIAGILDAAEIGSFDGYDFRVDYDQLFEQLTDAIPYNGLDGELFHLIPAGSFPFFLDLFDGGFGDETRPSSAKTVLALFDALDDDVAEPVGIWSGTQAMALVPRLTDGELVARIMNHQGPCRVIRCTRPSRRSLKILFSRADESISLQITAGDQTADCWLNQALFAEFIHHCLIQGPVPAIKHS